MTSRRVPSTYVVFLDQVASVAVFCDSFGMKRGIHVAMPRNSCNSSPSSGFQAKEPQLACLDSAFVAIDDQPMLRCRLYQLIEVGVVFLFGRPEHSYIICNDDSARARSYDQLHHFMEHVLVQIQADG